MTSRSILFGLQHSLDLDTDGLLCLPALVGNQCRSSGTSADIELFVEQVDGGQAVMGLGQ